MNSEADSRAVLKGRSILVVEDSAPVAMDIEDMLLEAGSHVIGPASSVEEALSLISQTEIQAGVLDINLDDVLVFPVARELRTKNIPFIFLSGYNAEDILPDEFANFKSIQKPLAEHLFLKEVSELFV